MAPSPTRVDDDFQERVHAPAEAPPRCTAAGLRGLRLTLWIDGEEREAAFGGRSQVREAYQKVVPAPRDPVLVTTSGRTKCSCSASRCRPTTAR